MNGSEFEMSEVSSYFTESETDTASYVSSEDPIGELVGDFTEIWKYLREVLQTSGQRVRWEGECPLLTDMVWNSADIVFRPYTVVIRVYPIPPTSEAVILPPISDCRISDSSLPSAS